MAPKKARGRKDAPATADELRSFSELWKVAKAHGIDWALKKVSEGPAPAPEAPRPAKRARKMPARYRDATPPGMPSTAQAAPQESAIQVPLPAPLAVPQAAPQSLPRAAPQAAAPQAAPQVPTPQAVVAGPGSTMGESPGAVPAPSVLPPSVATPAAPTTAPGASQTPLLGQVNQVIIGETGQPGNVVGPTPGQGALQGQAAAPGIPGGALGAQAAQVWAQPLAVGAAPAGQVVNTHAGAPLASPSQLGTSPVFLGSTVPT